MAKKKTVKVKLSGLRGNYSQNGYREGQVVYRKYNKEWHFYVTAMQNSYGRPFSTPKVTRAPNSIEFANKNETLLEALKRAGKPLSKINDKMDNERWGFRDIELEYDPTDGTIVGYEILVASPEDIKAHKEAVKERMEEYQKLPCFGAFMTIANGQLTYKLSEDK